MYSLIALSEEYYTHPPSGLSTSSSSSQEEGCTSPNTPFFTYSKMLSQNLKERNIRIKEVVAGTDRLVFFIAVDGSVYVLGKVDKCTNGMTKDAVEDWKLKNPNKEFLDFPQCIVRGCDKPMEKVIVGFKHTLFHAKDGEIYGCGDNDRRQMNFEGFHVSRAFGLRKIVLPNEPNTKFKLACSGCDFSVYITNDERMFSSGGNYSGQCGIGVYRDVLMAEINYKAQLESLHAPCTTITKINATYNTTIFLTADQKLYGFGDDSYGCLGCGELYQRDNYKIIRVGISSADFLKEQIADFSCGLFFVGVITCSNDLYVLGYNNFCQISCNETSQIYIPTKITPFNGIAQSISCGGYHSLLLTTDMRVFGTGDTSDYAFFKVGAQYHHFTELNLKPIFAKRKQDRVKTLSISAGVSHSVVYTLSTSLTLCFPFMNKILRSANHLSDVDISFWNEDVEMRV
ncbi:hypothetical protein C9374_009483 [Naegleria lovaniensis]|uniref:Uncharacterized protein n=1 Tax=Naegleria lovaniensis TaxID=51637 RepID=A0AA88H4X7_NAELO|nr:uncharacterized protein C9374_009483 [Naegleria lovaniensis]KAG2392906.1 hypothetical protein C9374_009483 [Naegleria lovaniensis]